uniref:Uncharacterized protein n=1 Tax=Brassica oleracea var. oleracea TaxID=109376 RepID=A0A0D3C0E1_BRAOL
MWRFAEYTCLRVPLFILRNFSLGIFRGTYPSENSEGAVPRKIPREPSLGKFRGSRPSENSEGAVPRKIPREPSLGKFRGSRPSENSEGAVPRKIPREPSLGKFRGSRPSENSEGAVPRKIPREPSLGKFRGTGPSVYTEGKVPRNKPRKMSVGILLSIDVYMSKNASIDELPRNYTDEVLPRLVVVVLEANLLVPGVVSVAARGIGDSSFSLMDPSGEYITKSGYNLARLSNNVSADQTLET